MKEISVKRENTEICNINELLKKEITAAPKAPIERQSVAKPTVNISIITRDRAIISQICHISIKIFFNLPNYDIKSFLEIQSSYDLS